MRCFSPPGTERLRFVDVMSAVDFVPVNSMKRILASLPLFLVASAAMAQPAPAPTATLKFDKPSAAAGSVVKGTLTITFADGLHGYQNPPADEYEIPVTVKVIEKGFTLVKATYPKGDDFTMAGESKPIKVYKGTITIPVILKAASKPGTYNVNVRVDYQQCNESACFPPGNVIAKSKLAVVKTVKATKS